VGRDIRSREQTAELLFEHTKLQTWLTETKMGIHKSIVYTAILLGKVFILQFKYYIF